MPLYCQVILCETDAHMSRLRTLLVLNLSRVLVDPSPVSRCTVAHDLVVDQPDFSWVVAYGLRC